MNAQLLIFARMRYAACLRRLDHWEAMMSEAIAKDDDSAFVRAINGSFRFRLMLVALERMYGEEVRV